MEGARAGGRKALKFWAKGRRRREKQGRLPVEEIKITWTRISEKLQQGQIA